MSYKDKKISISPNKGSIDKDPEILFNSKDNVTTSIRINDQGDLYVLSDNKYRTFQIDADPINSDSAFKVSDVSGIPVFEVTNDSRVLFYDQQLIDYDANTGTASINFDTAELSPTSLAQSADMSDQSAIVNYNFMASGHADDYPTLHSRRYTSGTYFDGESYTLSEENIIPKAKSHDRYHYVDAEMTKTLSTTEYQPLLSNTEIQEIGNTAPADSDYFAWELTESAASNALRRNRFLYLGTNSREELVASCYMKSNGKRYASILVYYGRDIWISAIFDLQEGKVHRAYSRNDNFQNFEAVAKDVGNGWYRCWVSYGAPNYNQGEIHITLHGDNPEPYDFDNDYAYDYYDGDGTSGIYLWGLQLEGGLIPKRYINHDNNYAYGTYQPIMQVAEKYKNRIDHDPKTGERLGLLSEHSSNNRFTHSSNLTKATKFNMSMDKGLDLFNKYSYIEAVPSAGSVTSYFTNTVIANNAYTTVSVYVKRKELKTFWIACHLDDESSTTAPIVYYDLENGTFNAHSSYSDSGMQDVGGGWYRCYATVYDSDNGTISFGPTDDYVSTADPVGYPTMESTGYKGLYIFGPQHEVSTWGVPSSYIPTGNSTFTRAQDEAFYLFADKIRNENAGTYFADFSTAFFDNRQGNQSTLGLFYDHTYNLHYLRFDTNAGGSGGFYVFKRQDRYNSSEDAFITNVVSSNKSVPVDMTVAGSFKADEMAIAYNGINSNTVELDNYKNADHGYGKKWRGRSNWLFVGNGSDIYTDRAINGHLRSFKYYDKYLNEEQLKSLTRV